MDTALRLRIEIERQTKESQTAIARLTAQINGLNKAIQRHQETIDRNNALLAEKAAQLDLATKTDSPEIPAWAFIETPTTSRKPPIK